MSVEAEQGLLGAMIASPRVHDEASERLRPDDFTDDRCRLLYELITKMRAAGRGTDPVTITAALGKSARWAATGTDDPLRYVDALVGIRPSPAMTAAYIDLVKSAATARVLLDYCGELAELAYDTTLSGEQKLAEAAALLPNVDTGSGGFVSYAEAARAAVAQINRRATGEVVGISSGMANVDRITGGFEPGTLVILGGRPSHGKSIYGMQWAQAAAKSGPVLVFSLEMSAANLAMRGLSSIGGVDFGEMRTGHVDEHMVAGMEQAIGEMGQMPLYIDDRGGISVDQLRTRARSMARREKPAMIVTDYLTLLSGVGNSRTEQVGYVSRSLKALAKELDCPVLCLAQLNRGVDGRTDKRPTLSDLRDSGEVEQDADIVAFTYLHEKYVPTTQRLGYGELIFAKQRNGETGSVFTEWQGRFQRFRSFEGTVPPEAPRPERAANDEPGMADVISGTYRTPA